jgi:hypothetical protein
VVRGAELARLLGWVREAEQLARRTLYRRDTSAVSGGKKDENDDEDEMEEVDEADDELQAGERAIARRHRVQETRIVQLKRLWRVQSACLHACHQSRLHTLNTLALLGVQTENWKLVWLYFLRVPCAYLWV